MRWSADVHEADEGIVARLQSHGGVPLETWIHRVRATDLFYPRRRRAGVGESGAQIIYGLAAVQLQYGHVVQRRPFVQESEFNEACWNFVGSVELEIL